MKTISLALLGLIALAQPSMAVTKTFASAPVGPNSVFVGAAMTCSIYNAGTDPIVLKTRTILDSSGASKTLNVDTCGTTPLAPRKSCLLVHSGDIGGPHVCRIRATGPSVKIRGVAAFRPSSSSVLMWMPIE